MSAIAEDLKPITGCKTEDDGGSRDDKAQEGAVQRREGTVHSGSLTADQLIHQSVTMSKLHPQAEAHRSDGRQCQFDSEKVLSPEGHGLSPSARYSHLRRGGLLQLWLQLGVRLSDSAISSCIFHRSAASIQANDPLGSNQLVA